MTVKRFEDQDGKIDGRTRTIEAIQRALERRGVEFIEENGGGAGVRIQKLARK